MNASLHGFPTPTVSTGWLSEHLGAPDLKVVDASLYLSTAGRDAHAEFLAAHIPGAVFADIDRLSDEHSTLPHTLLAPQLFAERIGALGIGSDDAVVVYDASGQNFSAPRLWWMLRTYGHERVSVLDGGLRRWTMDGHPVESGDSTPEPAVFHARRETARVRDLDAVRDLLGDPSLQVVDARSPGRFEATEPEPRAGIRGGHIPGSRNLHYARLVRDDGTLRPIAELRELVAAAGIDVTRPVVASCGSGVTACAV
ncbi:MAG: sulfurtransferase, partial [Gemmatimonadaceae bacterium]